MKYSTKHSYFIYYFSQPFNGRCMKKCLSKFSSTNIYERWYQVYIQIKCMKAYVTFQLWTYWTCLQRYIKNITNVFCHDMTCVFNLYNDKAEIKKMHFFQFNTNEKVIFVLTTLIMYNRHKQLTLFCNSAKFQNATCLFHILSQ